MKSKMQPKEKGARANPLAPKRSWNKWTPEEQKESRHYKRINKEGGNTDSYDPAEWQMLVAWFGGVCLRCGSANFTLDHVAPVKKGGSNAITNLQPLCPPCNSWKGTKVVDFRDPLRLVQILEMLEENNA